MFPWTAEGRRTLRSVTQTFVLIVILALVWRLAGPDDTHWLIGVIFVFVVGTQIIDGVRNFKIGRDGIEADSSGSAP